MTKKRTPLHGRAILGIVLVLFGIAMIARSLDLFPYELEDTLFSWPMLLVVLGVIMVFTGGKNATGWILLFIGGFFMLPRITEISYSFHEIFWPVLFIAVGVLILIKTFGRVGSSNGGSDSDSIDDVAILGGNERRVSSKQFKGGKITSIFGGSQINFMEAELAEGENVIEIFTLFGGSTLIVPKDWEVKVEVTSIFGGFGDKRMFSEEKSGKKGLLVIKGMAIFGGGEIKNV